MGHSLQGGSAENALGAAHAGQRAGEPGMCSSPRIPPGPRSSGPFSLPSLFIARGHRMTLGGRLVPRHTLSPLGAYPTAATSPLPRAPSPATCLLPRVCPVTLPPTLPPDSGTLLPSPHRRLAPARTGRTRRCRRSPTRRGAHSPHGAPHTLLPQPRTEPAHAPQGAPHTTRHTPHRELRTRPTESSAHSPAHAPPQPHTTPRSRPRCRRRGSDRPWGGAGAGPRPPTRKD